MAYTGSKAKAGRGTVVSIGGVTGGSSTATFTGTVASGSPTVTAVSSIAGLASGMTVSGTGITGGTTISAIGSGTITLSANATVDGTAETITATGSGGGTFVAIGELTNSSFTGSAWGTAETTNFDSGVDEEFISTTRNNGEVSLEGNAVSTNAGQVALIAAYGTGFKYNFKVQEAAGPGETVGRVSTFSALVTSYDETLTVKNAVTFSTKLKVSGAITVTAGS